MRPQLNSGSSDPAVHQQDPPITSHLDWVYLSPISSKSRLKGSSRHRQEECKKKHANKKWEKSSPSPSKKRIASPTASKSGETLHLGVSVSGVARERGSVPSVLRAENTQTVANFRLSSIRERS